MTLPRHLHFIQPQELRGEIRKPAPMGKWRCPGCRELYDLEVVTKTIVSNGNRIVKRKPHCVYCEAKGNK